jgi:hypothetical protein
MNQSEDLELWLQTNIYYLGDKSNNLFLNKQCAKIFYCLKNLQYFKTNFNIQKELILEKAIHMLDRQWLDTTISEPQVYLKNGLSGNNLWKMSFDNVKCYYIPVQLDHSLSLKTAIMDLYKGRLFSTLENTDIVPNHSKYCISYEGKVYLRWEYLPVEAWINKIPVIDIIFSEKVNFKDEPIKSTINYVTDIYADANEYIKIIHLTNNGLICCYTKKLFLNSDWIYYYGFWWSPNAQKILTI